jgi:hypothetical protein
VSSWRQESTPPRQFRRVGWPIALDALSVGSLDQLLPSQLPRWWVLVAF